MVTMKKLAWVLLFIFGLYLVWHQITPIMVVYSYPYKGVTFLRIPSPSLLVKLVLAFFYAPMFCGWHKSWQEESRNWNGNGRFWRRLLKIFCFSVILFLILFLPFCF